MTEWLQLTPEQRRASLNGAEYKSGIPAKVLEKDWWVTLTLKTLFQSAYAQHMVFKGGTSLSKCWDLISRFSEDIDIGLAPEAFGMEYKEDPTKSYVTKLKKTGCAFTSTILKSDLKNQFMLLGVTSGLITIEAAPIPEDHTDTDPQTLHLRYPSLYDQDPYIADEVKIEVSVRSLHTPNSQVSISSLLSQINPNEAYAETPFSIVAVEPKKTFLEKVFLLHEEFGKPDRTKVRSQRMSRHLYDLGSMVGTEVEVQALSDHSLYENLIKHRESYSRISWVNYKSLSHTTVTFVPPTDVIELYRSDYQAMQEQMIYGESVPFDQLIESLTLLQDKFRVKLDLPPAS